MRPNLFEIQETRIGPDKELTFGLNRQWSAGISGNRRLSG